MQFQRKHTFYYVFGALLFMVAIFFSRAEIANFWWETTHIYPELVLAVNPDSSLALQMGQYYFDIGPDQRAYDIDRAESFYFKALELDPSAPLAWHQLARIAFLHGQQTTALRRINKQIELTGDSYIHAYYVRGLIYGFRGETEKAIADFEKYASWDTKGWYTYNDIAWLHFREGRFEEALNAVERGLENNPDSPWLLMSGGVIKYNLGELQTAREWLDRAATHAEDVTIADWRAAYPGNDPKIAERGLAEFKNAIRTNQELVNSAATTGVD